MCTLVLIKIAVSTSKAGRYKPKVVAPFTIEARIPLTFEYIICSIYWKFNKRFMFLESKGGWT